jgi:hypothetical protein
MKTIKQIKQMPLIAIHPAVTFELFSTKNIRIVETKYYKNKIKLHKNEIGYWRAMRLIEKITEV